MCEPTISPLDYYVDHGPITDPGEYAPLFDGLPATIPALCEVGRAVVNCAHCADYACETLEGFLSQVPEARETLEGIRQQL